LSDHIGPTAGHTPSHQRATDLKDRPDPIPLPARAGDRSRGRFRFS
jgi:hypothetical protein